MKQILIAALMVIGSMKAIASPGEALISHIAVARAKANPEKFVFSVCQAGHCERLGSENGYTEKQIEQLNGHFHMVGAAVMGTVEGAVILYMGASGVAIGVGYLSFGWAVTDGIAFAAVPTAAVHFIKSLNAVNIYRDGKAESKIESAVSEMVNDGQASVVVYRNTDLNKTLKLANRIDVILKKIDQQH